MITENLWRSFWISQRLFSLALKMTCVFSILLTGCHLKLCTTLPPMPIHLSGPNFTNFIAPLAIIIIRHVERCIMQDW
ncbi:hypothetical protein J3R30DRAFT_3569162 [Lentinula aciculospora]|uniref:Uncharacterized protein n=1 Tax=Lentinula aciculospora TaxID=153920 RepID=A0A9W8ZWW8_9AGAR|nr:hypothetical protein J3R30DRAFT_3569162 [Lentinula aciculospora]